MSKLRLKDILGRIESGADYYCYEAPEEFHFWTSKHPWPAGAFKDYGVSLLSLKVLAAELGDSTRHTFNKKNPLRLDCGHEINKGSWQTQQTKVARFSIRADGASEVQDIMTELCTKTGLQSWEVLELQIYNSGRGAIIEFRKHNPNSSKALLYFWRVDVDNTSRLYPDVSLHEQQELIGGFQDRLAHCTIVKVEDDIADCAIKQKVKPRQVIRRRLTPTTAQA
jgi:hypothetical protein